MTMYSEQELQEAFERVCKVKRSIPREEFTRNIIKEIKAELSRPRGVIPPPIQDER